MTGRTNSSKETYELTGLPGSASSGVRSGPIGPKPCGLPGCIASRRNSTRPSPIVDAGQRLLDDVVRADADAAAGDQDVGADELVLDGARSVSASSATAATR